jgi:protein-S-isoprenylcysteine O-methyltransferase
MALAAGCVEFAIESLFLPSLKNPHTSLFMWLGFLIVIAGQSVRTLAMLTAARNFTHLVAERKEQNHVLVTHGIYR